MNEYSGLWMQQSLVDHLLMPSQAPGHHLKTTNGAECIVFISLPTSLATYCYVGFGGEFNLLLIVFWNILPLSLG